VGALHNANFQNTGVLELQHSNNHGVETAALEMVKVVRLFRFVRRLDLLTGNLEPATFAPSTLAAPVLHLPKARAASRLSQLMLELDMLVARVALDMGKRFHIKTAKVAALVEVRLGCAWENPLRLSLAPRLEQSPHERLATKEASQIQSMPRQHLLAKTLLPLGYLSSLADVVIQWASSVHAHKASHCQCGRVELHMGLELLLLADTE